MAQMIALDKSVTGLKSSISRVLTSLLRFNRNLLKPSMSTTTAVSKGV